MNRTVPGQHTFVAVMAVLILVLAACGSGEPTATPSTTSATASPTAVAVASTAPSFVAEVTPTPEQATPTPTPTPTATPKPTPKPVAKPAPKPTPAPPAGWTAPDQVGSAADCNDVTAEIDSAGRYHVAAECSGAIHYYFSTDAGGSWTARVFALAANREELDPRIGFQGDIVYVAYTRIIPDGACGGSRGEDVGVYFRSRTLPGGAWSAATRIGPAADELQNFQVDGGTLHATVRGTDGLSYYETLNGSTYHRYPISHVAIGPVSMHIGSDGRAQIAYAAGIGGIRYAMFTGSGFSTSRVAGTVADDSDPVTALDGSDKAHLVWTRYQPAACGMVPVGTYYATNASGTWKSQRVSKETGQTSLQIDAGGRIHLLIGLDYFTKTATGPWTRTRLTSTSWAGSPTLRLVPASEAVLVVYIDGAHRSRIYAITTATHHCGC